MTVVYNDIVNHVSSLSSSIQVIKLNPNDIIFEERVKLRCFYCSKYNQNWTCPPKIPEMDYQKLILEYENAAAVILTAEIDTSSYDKVRRDSSVELHKIILSLESYLYSKNNVIYNSFIGGSCKLCKNGCSPDKCRNPGLSRIPVEATGINLVETLKKYDVKLSFPPCNKMLRVGLILW